MEKLFSPLFFAYAPLSCFSLYPYVGNLQGPPFSLFHLLVPSLSHTSLDHSDYIRREGAPSVSQSTSPIKKKKKLLYLEQEGCFGNPLLWVECEYSVTESPIGNTSSRWRKISPILLGSDIWHTSGLPSIVFNYDLACRAMLSLCFFFFFFITPPFSPSPTNYTVDRCRVALTDWPTRLGLFFSPCFWSSQHKLPSDGHDNTLFFFFSLSPLALSLSSEWLWDMRVRSSSCSQSCLMNG